MSVWTETPEERRRWHLFNGRQIDPTRAPKRHGRAYFRRGAMGVLMPDDFMPVGEHASKHLRAVPVDYLLWVNAQPWARDWPQWQPVADYIARFITEGAETPPTVEPPAGPVVFVDPLQRFPGAAPIFRDGSAHLHTLPGHEDLLHAFAVGGLRLRRDWYLTRPAPHYDLTKAKHARALDLGAVQIDRRQMGEHVRTWHEFFRTKPNFRPE